MRQSIWGGWTCTQCGAELNRKLELIDGRHDSTDGIIVDLHPPLRRRDRYSLSLSLIFTPLLAVLALVVAPTVAQLLLILLSLGMLVLGLISGTQLAKTLQVTLTDTAIRWAENEIRPAEITDVAQDGTAVLIHTASGIHRLRPRGGPAALLDAIAEVRKLGRDTGSTQDVPDELTQLQAHGTVKGVSLT